jgi:putative ABC transport system substrate-binding protein
VATFVTPAATRALERPVSGVYLGHAPAEQVRELARALPRVRTIGIVFSDPANRATVEALRQAAGAQSLAVEAEEVRGDLELPVAVGSLARRVDVLWAIQDGLFASPLNVKKMLLLAFEFRLPVVGLSAAWVKGGAMLAMGWDYVDLGQQCAGHAVRLLDGTPAGQVPLEYPRKAPLYLNQKTAHALKIDVPGGLGAEIIGGDE